MASATMVLLLVLARLFFPISSSTSSEKCSLETIFGVQWANLLSTFLRFPPQFSLTMVGVAYFLCKCICVSWPSTLQEIRIPEEMFHPAVIFLLAFVILVGAWLGFCVVHKLALTQDGSIDMRKSYFVAWSIRIFASLFILQSSTDPVMAIAALIFVIDASSICSNIRSRCLNRNLKQSAMRKCKETPPFEDSLDEYSNNICSHQDSSLIPSGYRNFNTMRSGFGWNQSFISSFHSTTTRRRFSKQEWEDFTRDSTRRALEELFSSPNFGKWLFENTVRVTAPHITKSELNNDISSPYGFTRFVSMF